MIPNVRLWKVRVVETGHVFHVSAVNRRLARAAAMNPFLIGKTLKVSIAPYEDGESVNENYEKYYEDRYERNYSE